MSIKSCDFKSCKLASHFPYIVIISIRLINLVTCQPTFISELSNHMTLIIMESVKPRSGEDVETILKNREDFWPSTLKSTPQFGGIDKLSNRAKKKKLGTGRLFSHQSSSRLHL